MEKLPSATGWNTVREEGDNEEEDRDEENNADDGLNMLLLLTSLASEFIFAETAAVAKEASFLDRLDLRLRFNDLGVSFELDDEEVK